ncbi:IclR family transcriptional regulator [Kutzneria sp. NPDC052558]|uniref:IclR family transcriptional regulator n=1 Tax=Kutzneria sp. NPDC052558 TaxID=3364121 RepID=UPI0037C5EB95
MDDQSLPRSIGRAFSVFSALQEASGPQRLTELSLRTGLAKSTTHRMLSALTSVGLVGRVGDYYQPAQGSPPPRSDLDHETLRRLAPFLGDLLVRTGMTASLAVLAGTDVEFVHRVYSHHDAHSPSDSTGRVRALRSAAGRLLLAYDEAAVRGLVRQDELDATEVARLGRDLLRIRRRAFAELTGPHGTTCLAVPVRLPGCPTIALVAKGMSGQIDRDRTLLWLRRVSDAAMRDVCCVA